MESDYGNFAPLEEALWGVITEHARERRSNTEMVSATGEIFARVLMFAVRSGGRSAEDTVALLDEVCHTLRRRVYTQLRRKDLPALPLLREWSARF